MTKGCFFPFCVNSKSSHSFGNLLFDDHRGGVLIRLPAGVLEYVEVFG